MRLPFGGVLRRTYGMVVLPNAQTIGCVCLQPPSGGCARCRRVAFDARARRTRAPTAVWGDCVAATQLFIVDGGFEALWPRAPNGALAIGYYSKRCSAALLPLRGPSGRPPNRPSAHPLYFMSQQCTRAIPGLQQREAEGAEAGGEFGLAAGAVAVADFVEGGRMVHFRQMSQLVEYHEFAQFCR